MPNHLIKRQRLQVTELLNPGHDSDESFRHSVEQLLDHGCIFQGASQIAVID
jgi:hypothetical protein